jgi:putative oxidoreductase
LSQQQSIQKFFGSRGNAMVETIERRRLIVPALGQLYEALAPFSYAIMRFATGAVLLPHGVQKVFYGSTARRADAIAAKGLPFPLLLAYLTLISEFAAAACVAVGLLTRIAAAMIFVQMVVIVIYFQWSGGYFWTNRGYEFPLLWAALCLAIVFRGGGRWSVDHYLGKEF